MSLPICPPLKEATAGNLRRRAAGYLDAFTEAAQPAASASGSYAKLSSACGCCRRPGVSWPGGGLFRLACIWQVCAAAKCRWTFSQPLSGKQEAEEALLHCKGLCIMQGPLLL